MDNHYHLLVETNSPTLSKGMKFFNGTYTQPFNQEHNRVGLVQQGQFKSILFEKENQLITLRNAMLKMAKAYRSGHYTLEAVGLILE